MTQWKQNPVLAILAVVIIIASVAVIFILLRPKSYPTLLKCMNCEATFQMNVSKKTQFPLECLDCHNKTVYPAKKVTCAKCSWSGIIIETARGFSPLDPEEVQKLTETEKKIRREASQAPQCPKCGSTELTLSK